MQLQQMSKIMAEILREYGIMSVRFKNAFDGIISPEEAAQAYVEHRKKVGELCEQFNRVTRPDGTAVWGWTELDDKTKVG